MKGDVPEELHKILRKARIGAGLTQASLANKVGCTQSAISMMEAGRREAISRESLVKLADLLGVELPDSEKTDTYETEFFPVTGIAVCGNFNCLSNMPYLVGDEIYFYPLGMAGHGKHCVICGELIMCKCQTCDAPLDVAGGCCGTCGAPVVEFPAGYATDHIRWVDERSKVIEQFTNRRHLV